MCLTLEPRGKSDSLKGNYTALPGGRDYMLGEKNRWFSDTSALDAQDWKPTLILPIAGRGLSVPFSPLKLLCILQSPVHMLLPQ